MARNLQRFTARVHKIDINPCVDVPTAIVAELLRQAGKRSGPVPVRGSLEGARFQTTVVKFRGDWRLYLNTEMRRNSGTDTGDEVMVEMEFDPKPPEVPMPPQLVKALAKNRKAKLAFEKLSPSHQKEILRYLNFLKSEESLLRNIDKLIGKELKIR